MANKSCPIDQTSRSHGTKNSQIFTQIRYFWTVIPIWIHRWFEMMHTAWCSIKEVPCCFSFDFKITLAENRRFEFSLGKITRPVAAIKYLRFALLPLQVRHYGRGGVSNHQPRQCLLNRLFRRRSKRTSKLRVTGLWAGNSPVTGDFPAQKASNAENVSIWRRHHATSSAVSMKISSTW